MAANKVPSNLKELFRFLVSKVLLIVDTNDFDVLEYYKKNIFLFGESVDNLLNHAKMNFLLKMIFQCYLNFKRKSYSSINR